MIAAENVSGLIISIVHFLVNRTEYRGMKCFLELLNHTILMTRLALHIVEYTPISLNFVMMIEPTILGCRDDLQGLFDKLPRRSQLDQCARPMDSCAMEWKRLGNSGSF